MYVFCCSHYYNNLLCKRRCDYFCCSQSAEPPTDIFFSSASHPHPSALWQTAVPFFFIASYHELNNIIILCVWYACIRQIIYIIPAVVVKNSPYTYPDQIFLFTTKFRLFPHTKWLVMALFLLLHFHSNSE